jgi:glycerol-3-phosphate cytidylyltransferase
LNLINHAKEYCDYLIVGVNADRLVEEYKHKTPVIAQEERKSIIENIKAVDKCIIATTLDKVSMWSQLHFDAVFIGDDWKGDARWLKTQKDLAVYGVDVVYLPHTDGVSSTLLKPESGNAVGESEMAVAGYEGR